MQPGWVWSECIKLAARRTWSVFKLKLLKSTLGGIEPPQPIEIPGNCGFWGFFLCQSRISCGWSQVVGENPTTLLNAGPASLAAAGSTSAMRLNRGGQVLTYSRGKGYMNGLPA
jgi:hypothetical protein